MLRSGLGFRVECCTVVLGLGSRLKDFDSKQFYKVFLCGLPFAEGLGLRSSV